MRVIGFCRFSYPAIGGFKRMHDSVAARAAYLYAPERMELRFRHFETLTLPSIRAQTDPDFTFLIQIGEDLPGSWQERLFDLTLPVPQIKIVAQPPMRHREAAKQAIQAELEGYEGDSIQFRLDDDDAVGVDFIARCRVAAQDADGILARHGALALDFNRGYSVALSPRGIAAEEVMAPFWSCGLAVVFRGRFRKTVMIYSHHKLHLVMPMLIQPDSPMFLRANHDDNDSWEKIRTGDLAPLGDAERALFRDRFNVSEDHVSQVFAHQAVPRDTA